ncbi:MAG TPA: sensor domain-containing diguanylate cyclase [Candidatus Acidoferrum sp.]|nr:sensor domain-containing diguanylate cyclase [Candidatus Acidoferrum sp.]
MPPSLRPEHLLAAILSSTEDGLLSFSLNGTIQSWSRGAERLYGYAAAEITGRPVTILLPIYEVPTCEEFLRTAKDGTFHCCEKTERLRKDGSRIRVALKRAAVRDESGAVAGIVETASADGLHAQSPAAEGQLRSLVEQMPAILWTTDQSLRITSHWGAGLGPSKVRAKDLVGRTLYDYLKCQDPHAAPIAQHAEALRGVSSYFEYRHGNRHFAVHLSPLRMASGEIKGCVGAGIDITDRKKSEDQIRYQATHDALTGLANYREFMDTLETEVRRAERSKHLFALLLLDLDELKAINDKYGHLVGNRALTRLSEVIKDHSRATDLAARYGGDEFAVVLIDADPGMANRIAQRVERAFRDGQERPPLTVSIGISVYPEDGRTAPELLEAADRHLYKRKTPHTHRESARVKLHRKRAR